MCVCVCQCIYLENAVLADGSGTVLESKRDCKCCRFSSSIASPSSTTVLPTLISDLTSVLSVYLRHHSLGFGCDVLVISTFLSFLKFQGLPGPRDGNKTDSLFTSFPSRLDSRTLTAWDTGTRADPQVTQLKTESEVCHPFCSPTGWNN